MCLYTVITEPSSETYARTTRTVLTLAMSNDGSHLDMPCLDVNFSDVEPDHAVTRTIRGEFDVSILTTWAFSTSLIVAYWFFSPLYIRSIVQGLIKTAFDDVFGLLKTNEYQQAHRLVQSYLRVTEVSNRSPSTYISPCSTDHPKLGMFRFAVL